MKWIKIASLIIITSGLSGCLANNLSWSDTATGLGAVAGAGISAAVGLPPVTTIASTAVGAAAGSLAVADPVASVADVIHQVPEEQRASVLKWQGFWELLESLGWYVFIGLGAWFFIPMFLGYLIPRRKELKLEKEMTTMKDKLFDNNMVKMNDIK